MSIRLFSVRNDLESRFQDVETMLMILEENTKVERQLILKSSLMLMIYNIVEGTISNLLMELFDNVQGKLSIDELPRKLQLLIFEYHLKNIGTDSVKLLEFSQYNTNRISEVSYLEIQKYLNLFSGNLDSRSIRKISSKVGINLPNNLNEESLLQVKNSRNKLAHGEMTFRKNCQDITLDDLKIICKKVKSYLEKVVDEYEKFLNRIREEESISTKEEKDC